MAIIVLELPDFIEEKAKSRGLLSSELYEDFIQKAICATDKAINPRDFSVFVKNVVSPDMFSKHSSPLNTTTPPQNHPPFNHEQ